MAQFQVPTREPLQLPPETAPGNEPAMQLLPQCHQKGSSQEQLPWRVTAVQPLQALAQTLLP
jgi:hypothetical protein